MIVDKLNELTKIANEIEGCRICKIDSVGKAVPGEGNPDAKIMFVGEAPGKEEAKVGRPFIGRSGKLLRTTMEEAGINQKSVYITSPVKYLPERGTPSKEQIIHGRNYLNRQIKIINPKIIVLLGKVAGMALLDKDLPIAKVHGTTFRKDGITYFVMYHPAAAIRFVKLRSIFKEDFRKLAILVKKAKL